MKNKFKKSLDSWIGIVTKNICFRVLTKFHLSCCWQKEWLGFKRGTLYYDGVTYFYLHLGRVTFCVQGYLN